MFTGNYKKRIDLLKKVFHRKCLFCEVVIESSVEGFEKEENQTVLSLCEFCLNKFEVIQELKRDKDNEGKGSEERIKEIAGCFHGKCYFCDELTVKWKVGWGGGKFYGENILKLDYAVGLHTGIHSCDACFARYNSLCELEQEKKRLETEQQLKTQIEIPPKSGN